MYVSSQCRGLFDAYMSFCRGAGVDVPFTGEVAIEFEYAAEITGRKSPLKVCGAYFSGAMGTERLRDVKQFTRQFIGVTAVSPQAESLYVMLCQELYIADWTRIGARFLSGDLVALAPSFLPVAEAAITQCVQYNGRSWAYFRKVCEQLAVTHAAIEIAKDKAEQAKRLPPGFADTFYVVPPRSGKTEMLRKFKEDFDGAMVTAQDDAEMERHAKETK